jgi:hypothetical protein
MKRKSIQSYRVKEIMPCMSERLCRNHKKLDFVKLGEILLINKAIHNQKGWHGTKSEHREQRTTATKAKGIKPKPGEGHRRAIQDERILRPKRSPPSTIRNDTKAPRRQGHDQRSGTAIRSQQSNIPQICVNVRQRRHHRADISQARTAKPTQMYTRDHRIRNKQTEKRTQDNNEDDHFRGERRIWSHITPEDHRTCACQISKKGEKSTGTTIERGTIDSKIVMERYEQLRAALIITGESEVSFHGLNIFMLQGMRAWIEALPAFEPTTVKNMQRSSSKPLAPVSKSLTDLIHVLATMIAACIGGTP